MPAKPLINFDPGHSVLAHAAWSRLTEPTDPAAVALLSGLGAVEALDWLLHQALDADGAPRDTPSPPPGSPQGARASAAWAQATSRWAPRLRTLEPERDLEVLEQLGGSLVLPGDVWWPPGLNELEAPPICLWVRGDPALLVSQADTEQEAPEPGPQMAAAQVPRHREQLVPAGPGRGHALALVGARAATSYGEGVAMELGAGLAARGCVVVSGGAFGIDAAAHRGALSGGRTVSVSAGGVDRLYPAGNSQVLSRIVEEGALVAEVPPGCAPARHRFLTRNRLIAAMTEATVVVEAAWRSGALSTAHQAQGLGRPVGAVPGPVTAMSSVGCHRLLRAGATCVTDAEEALELVAPLGTVDADLAKESAQAAREPGLLDGLEPDCAAVLDAMPARGAAALERLARVAGLGEAQTSAALGLLELDGRVERDGTRWRRRRPVTKAS
ncbi:Transposase and inactivated derivatives [Actinomyces bovis]|uniref:Transposase and inactivated derivatives n=1 Tax=Actinomyces bovis TaxID=1658 RepID=A0ABY1VME6_9ACTO|nr:DNA-protecting protein DprA [Actinomyces bovis]SPT52647.1 Transposase and inactivated derivatives [Actinomyces bovis]VEG54537.1 Transposase and inactivated derivatives [Actinomyces israelii]